MAAVIKITVNSSSSGSGINDAKRDVQGLGQAAQNSGGGFTVLKGVAVNALTAVGSAAIGAVGSVAGFVSDSVGAAATFEASMFGLEAVTGSALGNAGFDLDDVSAKALQLGADTQFSAQQAVEAMTELAKGGVPVVDIMGEATDATLALASATGLDLAQSAEIVAKQLGVWSETGVTAAEVTDLLASAANASTVDVDELALGLANAGGTAKTAGVEFDDLVQTMALIAPNFSSASDAGTSLKTFISRLIPTTDSATDAMMALGLATEDGKSKFFDASGSFIGMEQAARLLQEATAGLSEEERLLAFNTIFGADAIRTASAIANAGSEGFNAMGIAMEESGGAAASAATKNQGFAFAMEQLKGSIETVQIVLGTLLLPVLTNFLTNVVTPGVNQILIFAQAITSSTDPLGTMRAQLEGLIPGIGGVIDVLVLIGGAIGVAISWFQQGGAASLQLGTDFWSVYNSTSAVFSGIQSIIGAVLGIVNTLITEHGSTILASFTTAWNSVSAMVSAVTTAIHAVVLAIFGQVSTFLHAHGDEIAAFLAQTWSQIAAIISTAAQLVQAIVVPIFRGIASFINSHGSEIQGYLTAAWNIIKALISGTLDTIKGLLTAALAVIRGDWQGAWDAIKGVLQAQLSAGVEIAKNALELLKGAFSLSIEAIKGLWGAFADSARSIGSSIIDGIIDGVESAASALASAAVAAVNDALDAAKSAIGFGSPAKKFIPLGLSMDQGMAIGLHRGAPMVASAGAASASAALAGASSTYHNNQRSLTYSPTINNYGKASDGLDYATARSLAGV